MKKVLTLITRPNYEKNRTNNLMYAKGKKKGPSTALHVESENNMSGATWHHSLERHVGVNRRDEL